MGNDSKYEQIEAYLEGTLPGEQRNEIERRMAEDQGFRQEVDLHRELQEHFSDPQRWHLQNLMDKIMAEPPPPKAPTDGSNRQHNLRSWWRWILPLALLVGAGGWYFWPARVVPLTGSETEIPHHLEAPAAPAEAPPASDAAEPPTPAPLPAPPAPAQRTPPRPTPSASPSPSGAPSSSMPIAQADPADFIPNRSMEMLILSGNTRSGQYGFSFSTPHNESNFTPEDGEISLRFKGSVAGSNDDTALAFSISILSAKDISRPLLSIPVALPSGIRSFDEEQKMKLGPGLYYYVVTPDGEGSDAYYGKFTVGKE
jgi:hypothetical protein